MLRSMSIHGFKSFCDRTEVAFGSGITAIVGPNGCGKSNLADALRWVLGEHNARLLRCNKLEELIFSGTQRRKAMGMAEVRLLLEDVLDDGEREIMRRFTRDGSGEYRINNKVCRWKDIYESLLGTGLSHTGYVVIGQGSIQELAGGRPEDRTAWIEEASGVSRFRLSQKEVERKLSAAQRDIIRLDDLLAELEARKTALYSDWEIASKYHKLVNKINDVELSMWLHQEQEESRRVQNVLRRLQGYRERIQECILTIDTLKAEVEPVQNRLANEEERLKSGISERETIADKLLSLEKNRDAARGKLALVSREIETRTVRANVLEDELNNLSGRKVALKDKYETSAEKFKEASDNLKNADDERQAFEAMWRSLSQKVISIRTSMASFTAQLTKLQQSKDTIRRQLESKRRESVEIRSHLLSLDEQILRLKRELSDSKQGLAGNIAKYEQSQATCNELEKQVTQLRNSLDEMVSTEKNLEQKLTRLKMRKRLLEEMERTFEGYGKGPRAILTARKQSTLAGIIGSVGELFSCDPQYVPALSAAVGGAAENIVVTDDQSAKAAIDFLKRSKQGRCTFLPLSLIRPRKLHPKAVQALSRTKGVKPLISVVNYPGHLRACAEYLFGRVILADTVDYALAFMKESSWITRVVTMGGENIQPGGAITGGEAPRHESIFLRKQELTSLTSQVKKIDGELRSKKAQVCSLKEELSALTGTLKEAKEDALLASNSVAGLRDRVAQLEATLEWTESEIGSNKQKLEPLISAEQTLIEQIEKIAAQEKSISDRITSKETELKGYEKRIRDGLSIDEKHSDKVRHLSREKEELQQRLNSLLRQLESVKGEKTSTEKNLDEERKELVRLKELREQLTMEESSLKQSILSLEKRMGVLRHKVLELQKRSDSLRQTLNETLESIESLNLEKTSFEGKVADGRTELETLEKSHRDTKELIVSRYGIENPGDCEHPRTRRQEALIQIEGIESAIKLLGTVNLKAEQDYLQLSERIEHIHSEKNDVENAIDELNRTRSLIKREIHKRFLETFEEVDQNFQRIFTQLFGGGRGKLNLVEDTMGIEVIAEPPGSRQKQFNLLSGGERSLCGIALIFAVLAAKPSPVIVLDEVDSSLDEANVVRFAQFLKKYSKDTQFVVITHQESTMEVADIIYGVTMEEPGVSKIFSMRLENR